MPEIHTTGRVPEFGLRLLPGEPDEAIRATVAQLVYSALNLMGAKDSEGAKKCLSMTGMGDELADFLMKAALKKKSEAIVQFDVIFQNQVPHGPRDCVNFRKG